MSQHTPSRGADARSHAVVSRVTSAGARRCAGQHDAGEELQRANHRPREW
jgi:hypothetical protein